MLARKHGFSAAQIRFSDKLEWIEHHGRMVLRKAAIDPNSKTITIFTSAIEANFPKDHEDRTIGMLKTCIRALGDGNWDEDEHPRDEDGKFTTGGGGATDQNDGADAAVVGANEPELHPETIDVTGDEWNKQTAIRLEKEYQTVKPELESLIHKSVGEEVDTAVDEDEMQENAPIVPDSWDMLGEQQQEDVKTAWKESTKSEFLDSEISNWQENGGAKEEANLKVASDFGDGETDWAQDTIKEWMEARAENNNPVPYTSDQILNSLSIEYDGNGEGTGDVKIEFDDDKLKTPQGFDPNQQLLPGIEEIDPASYLSVEMRDELEKELERAFDKEAEDKVSDIEPPNYLGDSVDEYQDEYWDQKDDDEKFKIAQNNTDIINEAQQEYDQYFENNGNSGASTEVAIPDTFDPLQTEGGSDYKKTHALVTFMSRERAYQLLEKRGLTKSDGASPDAYKRSIASIDKSLWQDWKDSSAGSFGGQILQLASHEELGARYREMPTHRDDLIKQADEKWRHIGGFAGIKAMVRAKWETSQYALDKAGIHSLPVYRGLKVNLPDDEPTEFVKSSADRSFQRFTDAAITRNGAYSTTTTPSVANNWSAGSGTKVVLRIDAPRTAVLSFPAYGINIHEEKEVVLAGTAFKNWDAWKDRAPSVIEVPIGVGKAA